MEKEVIKKNSTRALLAAEKVKKTIAAAAEADQDRQNGLVRQNNLKIKEKKAKSMEL